VIHALRMMRMEAGQAHMLDALRQALIMLERRHREGGASSWMIAERRDRSSKAKLPEVMERVERLNAAVLLADFFAVSGAIHVRPKTAEDLKPEAERIKMKKCDLCPPPDDTVPGFGTGRPDLRARELMRLHQPDLRPVTTLPGGGP